jgi:NADH:ubiquinone oxidoreductase subunit 4 (subunit M)
MYFIPSVYALALTGIIFASFAALRQTDLKKIIAYSSVAHMNMVVLSIFSCSIFGLMGAVVLMLAHGVVASALFILIGCLYSRFGSRHVYYYSGLVATMPKLAFFFFIFAISNFAFPGTANFVGEVLVFISI